MPTAKPLLIACVALLALPGITLPAVAFADDTPAAYPKAMVKKYRHPHRDYYPQEGAEHELSGAASVVCTVLATGRLSACEIVAESPVGYGFGRAVVNLGEEQVIVDLDQHTPGQRVLYTVTFDLKNGRGGRGA